MKMAFVEWCQQNLSLKNRDVFLTADLGFDALEPIASKLKEQFINVGVAEQNMINIASGLAAGGMRPFCYSIASFAVHRAIEQIRINVALPRKNVKIVGNGSGYSYGQMGPTHHSLEDLALMTSLPNFETYIPFNENQVSGICHYMYQSENPSYLRLGFRSKQNINLMRPAQKLIAFKGSSKVLTVVAIGTPANAVFNLKNFDRIDFFIVQKIPIDPEDWNLIRQSLIQTQKLVVIEDHAGRGGIGELMTHYCLTNRLRIDFFEHLYFSQPESQILGDQEFLFEKFGMSDQQINEKLSALL